MSDQPFANQVAVVTGAGAGIGRAIAVELAVRGAIVYLVARGADALSDVQRVVEERGGRARALPGDVSAEADLVRMAEAVRAEAGQVDVLVHSAAAYARGDVESTPIEQVDEQYRTNVRGPYRLTQLLLPMIKPVQGQIVFINSTAGMTAGAGVSAYAASKHALRALADSLRDEVNPLGIRVASIYPGRTNTPMQQRVHEMEGKTYHGDRLMQPHDVAQVVVMTLALPKTAEVTNVTVRPARKS